MIISLGCRLSPALIIDQNLKSKNKKIIVDIDRHLKSPIIKFDKKYKIDVNKFLLKMKNELKYKKLFR